MRWLATPSTLASKTQHRLNTIAVVLVRFPEHKQDNQKRNQDCDPSLTCLKPAFLLVRELRQKFRRALLRCCCVAAGFLLAVNTQRTFFGNREPTRRTPPYGP